VVELPFADSTANRLKSRSFIFVDRLSDGELNVAEKAENLASSGTLLAIRKCYHYRARISPMADIRIGRSAFTAAFANSTTAANFFALL
jgi:hypothetical protein